VSHGFTNREERDRESKRDKEHAPLISPSPPLVLALLHSHTTYIIEQVLHLSVLKVVEHNGHIANRHLFHRWRKKGKVRISVCKSLNRDVKSAGKFKSALSL
jgi:hypothetical protein